MRALFASLLAATLIGCASVPHTEKSADRTATASKVGAKYAKPIKSRKTKSVAKVKHPGTTIGSRATQPGKADPVAEKAKAAIAAMLEHPESAQFYDLERAPKKLLDKTVDTICGHVKAKTGSGEDTREMAFLYTVDDGEAYLVTGTSHVAETVHRALCK